MAIFFRPWTENVSIQFRLKFKVLSECFFKRAENRRYLNFFFANWLCCRVIDMQKDDLPLLVMKSVT